MATNLYAPLFTVEDFLEIDFGPERKVELDNGVIRMMAGGTNAHSRVQGNIFAFLRNALRGSGCRPHASDMGVTSHFMSLRYPDVSVFCGHDGIEDDLVKKFDDPKVIVEVLSPSTEAHDQTVKLLEYKAISTLDAILYVDPDHEWVRVLRRDSSGGGWSDDTLKQSGADGESVVLPTLNVTIPLAEVFARD